MNTAPSLAPIARQPLPAAPIQIAPARFALFVNVFLRKPIGTSTERVIHKTGWTRRPLRAAA
jgi:hypothetical protein